MGLDFYLTTTLTSSNIVININNPIQIDAASIVLEYT